MMNKAPTIYTLERLLKTAVEGTEAEIDGKWVPARPLGYYSIKHRIKAAWLVFTGKADAVTWPGDQ